MSIKSNVTKALTAAHSYGDAITALKSDCAGMTRDAAKAAMLPTVATFYSVTLVDGQKAAKGTKVLNADCAKYEAAKKAIQRLLDDVIGVAGDSKREPVAVPAAKVAAAVTIAEGMTRTEFNAWLSAVRAAVAFE